MYLVDTNVISAAAPAKAAAPGLVRWMEANSAALWLSVVAVAEIESGTARLRREGAVARADRLGAWLDTLLHLYGERVLPFDLAAARVAGAVADAARGAGHAPGFADVAIAATAKLHGLTVLTRNVRRFEPLGVPLLDPFVELPP
jgi:predicted nucleic acid-binding protein